MRTAIVFCLLVLLCPTAVIAQNTSTQTAPGRGRDITRDQYLEKVRERAAARFDKADTNHDGVLSAAERRAAHPQRRGSSSPGSAGTPASPGTPPANPTMPQ